MIPSTVAGAIADQDQSLGVASLASSAAAVVAYIGLFTLLGVLTRRAVVWGFLYILVWEGFIGSVGAAVALLSIRGHSQSILGDITGEDFGSFTVAPAAAAVGASLFLVLGIALTSLRLRTADVP